MVTIRVWWIVAFIVSMCCCCVLIHTAYDNWDQRLVIVSFDGKPTSVWEITFPAVTICPSTKFEQYNMTDLLNNIEKHTGSPFNVTVEELNLMLAYNNVCVAKPVMSNFTDNFTDISIKDFIKKIAPSLNYTVQKCNFPNGKFLCQFEEIMTEEGLCFTFNMLNGKETYNNESTDYSKIGHNKTARWNLENGYDSNIKTSLESYPYRVSGSGADRDRLYVALYLSNEYLSNTCFEQGFKIVLHTPGEIPQVSKYFFSLTFLEEAEVSVKPIIITTSEELRPYPPHRRKCYFNSERKLRFLKLYTQRNCELECLSNFTLTLCGCVQFYMLSVANTPICGPAKSACYNWARNNLLNGRIREGQDNTEEEIVRLNKLVEDCDCLPACTSVTYDVDILKIELDKENKAAEENIDTLRSNLIISFKENQITALTRSELYRTVDFIATCGGLLGLFIGASFLSIVEVLYYCFLRLYCHSRTKIIPKQENKISITSVATISVVNKVAERISRNLSIDISK